LNPAAARRLPQILLLADALRGAGLARWLDEVPPRFQIRTVPADLDGPPQLVIWSLLEDSVDAARMSAEVRSLLDRWQPAPLLLVLPGSHPYSMELLLRLPAQGLLDNPDQDNLRQAVDTLLGGGRVVDLSGSLQPPDPWPHPVPGLGEWLLTSGLQQIDAELALCQRWLASSPPSWLALMLLQGRVRELRAARQLLLWIWGPALMAWSSPPPIPDPPPATPSTPPVAITLRQRTAEGLWEALRQRLQQSSHAGPINRSGQLLALDGLQPERRSDLLLALLEQFEQLLSLLRGGDPQSEDLPERWLRLQPELRRAALRRLAGPYVQLPCDGALRPVAETLAESSELNVDDPELPDPEAMLTTLLQARPLLVDGRLIPPDEPQAVIYLEMLLANWLVRSAEIISAEVLAASATWPELRRYLLRPELLPTRNLERLRNQLNAQQRWVSWVNRPIHLYESRRPMYQLTDGAIRCVDLTEPRDKELAQLGWPQQLVTLALEARDALGPQLRSVVKGLGDLVVVLLTQVLGRAIGLVGRGIVQGMGRGLGRS
jgi:hypothetical protein